MLILSLLGNNVQARGAEWNFTPEAQDRCELWIPEEASLRLKGFWMARCRVLCLIIPALGGGGRREAQEFKVSLGYIVHLKPPRVTGDTVSDNTEKTLLVA